MKTKPVSYMGGSCLSQTFSLGKCLFPEAPRSSSPPYRSMPAKSKPSAARPTLNLHARQICTVQERRPKGRRFPLTANAGISLAATGGRLSHFILPTLLVEFTLLRLPRCWEQHRPLFLALGRWLPAVPVRRG